MKRKIGSCHECIYHTHRGLKEHEGLTCLHYCNRPEVDREIRKPKAARNCPYLVLMDSKGMKAAIEGTIPPPTWIKRQIEREF
jgi:hypothetical protein